MMIPGFVGNEIQYLCALGSIATWAIAVYCLEKHMETLIDNKTYSFPYDHYAKLDRDQLDRDLHRKFTYNEYIHIDKTCEKCGKHYPYLPTLANFSKDEFNFNCESQCGNVIQVSMIHDAHVVLPKKA